MNRILLVEDDQSLGATLRERLGSANYDVVWVQNIQSATLALEEQKFDLLVLDVGFRMGPGLISPYHSKEKLHRHFCF